MKCQPKNLFRPAKDPLLEDSVLDEATRRLLLHNLVRERNSGIAKSTSSEPLPSLPNTDVDGLNASMLTRLNVLEKHAAVLQKELKEKTAKLIAAEETAASLEQKLTAAETEKLILATRLAEMNRFLADYGLTFVGLPSEEGVVDDKKGTFDLYKGQFDPAAIGMPSAPPAAEHASVPFDVELAKHQAERLSCSIANTTVQTNGRTGIIKERDTVYVCVYADGICVNSGPFRPYGWPLCDAFLSDLLEGYFPYEFKERYPDGFPIEILDRSGEACPRHTAAAGANIASVGDQGCYKPLDREALLRRLPQQYVTASGKLVDVQSGVAEFIGAHGSADVPRSITATTPAAAEDKQNAPNILKTSIKVRFAMGHEVLLKMFHSDTIADLRRELLSASKDFFDSTKPFELCSVYPRRTYDQHDLSLATAGLIPSATLQIKLVVP